MPRAHRVTKAEIARIVAGLKAAGETVGRIEIEPGGKVSILLGKPEATLTPLERWELEHGRGAPDDDQPAPIGSGRRRR